MTGRKVFAGIAVALMAVPVIAQATHKPGHEDPGGAAPTLSISATPNPVTYSQSTVISGKLKGQNTGAKAITLESDPHPFADNGFTAIANATTDANGDYTFKRFPTRSTRYRVRAASYNPDIVSTVTAVLVRIKVGLRLSDLTPRKGQLVTFSGTTAPPHDGRTVRIQRRTSTGGFVTVGTATLVDAGTSLPRNSRYSVKLRINRSGVYRARVAGDGDHHTGVSSLRSAVVH